MQIMITKSTMVQLKVISNSDITTQTPLEIDHEKNHKFLDKSIYFQLSKANAFMVMTKMIIIALTLFLIKQKTRNIIMKTEQTTIVYAQWDRWTSCDVIKHNMITTDVH